MIIFFFFPDRYGGLRTEGRDQTSVDVSSPGPQGAQSKGGQSRIVNQLVTFSV